MQTFNKFSPWLFTVLAIVAVACGLNDCPTTMPLIVEIDGVDYREHQFEISFNGREQDCFGDHEKDGVFQLVGCDTYPSDPLSHVKNALPSSLAMKH